LRGVFIHLRWRPCALRRRLVVLHAVGRPSFTLGLSHATEADAFEIFSNGASIAVSIGRTSREQLGDDRL
jgi:hypothetical protein